MTKINKLKKKITPFGFYMNFAMALSKLQIYMKSAMLYHLFRLILCNQTDLACIIFVSNLHFISIPTFNSN